MKLKKEMLTHFMDGSQVMVSTDKDVFSGIVYDAPMDIISSDVDDVISKLRSIGVIDE